MFHQPLFLFAAVTVLAPIGTSQSVQVLGGGCPGTVGPAVSGPMRIGTHVQFDHLGTCTPYNGGCHGIGCSGDGYLVLGVPGPALPLLLQGPGAPWLCPAPFDLGVLVVLPGFNGYGYPVAIQLQIPNNAGLVGFALAAAGVCTRVESQQSNPYNEYLTPALAVTIGP